MPKTLSSNLDFTNSLLYITPRSPFARRVRLAFLEHGVDFKEEVCDVFKPTAKLFEVNPLARVPVLKLKSGEVLIDSHLILQVFYENTQSPLKPKSYQDQLTCHRWTAIATGLCDKLVEYYIESLKPKENQDPEMKMDLSQIIERILPQLERRLTEQKKETDSLQLVSTHLTQSDLDMGTGLTYLKLRYAAVWQEKFPTISQYFDTLAKRDSFLKTVPPAP